MLEFRQKEDGHTLYIEAQDSENDKGIWFTLITPRNKDISFDFLNSEQMFHLATYLNAKLGFDFCNIENVKKIWEEEKVAEYNKKGS